MTNSRKVHNFPGLGGSLDWSPTGKVFATEGPENSGMIDIRDAETGASVLSFHGHDIDVNDVAFSPDGSMLATTGDDGTLRVWNSSTGDKVAAFGGGGQVWSPAISPDGSMVAASWVDRGLVRIFDIASGNKVAEIRAPRAYGMSFSSDGKLIAFGNGGAPIATIADVASGSIVRKVGEGEAPVFDLAFSPDGRLLATASPDGSVRIWDVATGEKHDTLRAHQAGVNTVDWNADGTRLATASDDGTARVFDMGNGAGRELFAVSDIDTANGLQSVAFSPDGNQIMTADGAMTAVKIWNADAAGGAEWLDVTAAPGTIGGGFANDGDAIVVSAGDGGARMWDIASGDLIRGFGDSDSGDGHNMLAVSRDGHSIAAIGPDNYPVEAWDVDTGAHLFSVQGNQLILALAWSHDGQRLAIAEAPAAGGRIRIVDRAGTEVATLNDQVGVSTYSMAFSPDGTKLVANRSSDAGAASTPIWDIATESVVAELPVMANAVEFDPTGTRILTASPLAPGLQIWDAASSAQTKTVDGPSGILDIAVDPLGAHVAGADLNGTVPVWNTDSWTQELTLHGTGNFIRTVEFGPDGSRLLSIADDGNVRVWALDVDDLTPLAEHRLTRTFTADECRRYLHLDACPA
jgi:WD40 repeat protein